MAIVPKPVTRNGSDFFATGVSYQVVANTPKQAKAAFAYSCACCQCNNCDKNRCEIYIAHTVALQRMEKLKINFLSNAISKLSKAYMLSYLQKNFEGACMRCKKAGYFDNCEGCPIKQLHNDKFIEIVSKD